MREIRLYGSEGGVTQPNAPSLHDAVAFNECPTQTSDILGVLSALCANLNAGFSLFAPHTEPPGHHSAAGRPQPLRVIACALLTNSDLARLHCLRFREGQDNYPLLHLCSDLVRVDGRVQVEDAAVIRRA